MHSNGYSTSFVFVSTEYRAAYKQYRAMRMGDLFLRLLHSKDTYNKRKGYAHSNGLPRPGLAWFDALLRAKVTLGILSTKKGFSKHYS